MRKIISVIVLSLLPYLLSAAETIDGRTTTYFSNPLFNTLLIIIIILAIMVSAFGSALKNVINSDFFIEKIKKEKQETSKPKVLGLLLFFFLSLHTFAQDKLPVYAVPGDGSIGGLDAYTFYAMIVIIAIELLVLGVLFNTFKSILATEKLEVEAVMATKNKTKSLLDKLNDTVEIEKEESILLDHDYDGIKELDNNLPPWWKYGFYLTILIAIIYMINYHVTKTAPLQGEEYTNSIKKAEKEIAEYMKTSANNVDESTLKMLTDVSDLSAGKDIFISTCAACHGKFGEGTVGPNLTDDYWVHGGGLKDIFKTIKYGWPDKGMKSWKEDFSPVQIAQLTSYIRTLKGTNPPKPKDKQGELYIEQMNPSDSITVKVDSTKTLISNFPLQKK